MRKRAWFLWRLIFPAALVSCSAAFVFGAVTARTINLPDPAAANAVADDDEIPDVTARVARISFLRGDAQVKRIEADDWERATLNLPIVEGDEITTGAGSRLEIQFGNYQHLRLDENAYLKVSVLRDEGIAVSLSLGTMIVRITRFDEDKEYFEIDAPRSTIAIQKHGQYRVDAGQAGDSEIRVAVSEGGEARVYSESAGFTLKNNRSARVFIEGDYAGEWQPLDRRASADEFDQWSRDRDELIENRLNDAYYDKYYDQDIYGADDLNGYGEWVYISPYGYVWRPYANTLTSYADWSPYRYGTWRWVPPYGWTWVNDEPWGWATYHHGRWIFHSGRWYWTPYGYYRPARSWWFPALVMINVFNNNVCWYPLGYHHSWHNYNAWYNHNNGGHHGGGHQPPGGGPTPHPTPPPVRDPRHLPNASLGDDIPPGGVVTVGADDFGKIKAPVRTAPLSVAKAALAKTPDYESAPVVPALTARKTATDVIVPRPTKDRIADNTRVGAAPRKTDAPLDDSLRKTRILGGREPAAPAGDNVPARDRQPGVVIRPPVKSATPANDVPIRQVPPVEPAPVRKAPTIPPPAQTEPTQRPPVRTLPPPSETPIRQVPPSQPPPTRQPPRVEPAPVKQPPVEPAPVRRPPVEPAPVRQPPRVEPAPVRQTPRQDPPKSEAPPSKASPAKSPPASRNKANNSE